MAKIRSPAQRYQSAGTLGLRAPTDNVTRRFFELPKEDSGASVLVSPQLVSSTQASGRSGIIGTPRNKLPKVHSGAN